MDRMKQHQNEIPSFRQQMSPKIGNGSDVAVVSAASNHRSSLEDNNERIQQQTIVIVYNIIIEWREDNN